MGDRRFEIAREPLKYDFYIGRINIFLGNMGADDCVIDRSHNRVVGYIIYNIIYTNLVQHAFGSIMGTEAGAIFVAICLCFFAFSSILCWNFFGKINTLYLFRKRNTKKAVLVYTLISLCFVMLGSLVSSDFVWELTDMFNNLMVIPNVLALFSLTHMVIGKAK